MTRIRYIKSSNNPDIFVAKELILLPNGTAVKIALNTVNHSYQFINASTVEPSVVSEGTAKNLLALKKLVRSTLLELGVPLEVEVKNFKKVVTGVAA